jgi:transposase
MELFLSAAQFERVYRRLQGERKIHTQQREVIRQFLAAVCWIGRSGAQWRFLPTEYGKWNSVYKRFARWDALGVWARLFDGVAAALDLQSVRIDATVVRAHACAAGAPQTTAGRRRNAWGARAVGSAPSSLSSWMPAAIP